MATPRSNSYAVASGAGVHAGRPPGLPAWRPAAGDVAVISASGTLSDIDPAGAAFDPGTEPWKTSNNYVLSTITGYCGGAWIDELRMFAAMGGGHASYCVPALYAWAADLMGWEWLQDPLPSDGLSGATGDVTSSNLTLARASVSGYGDKFDSDEWHWLGDGAWPTGFDQAGVIQPEPGHSYFGDVHIPGAVWGNAGGALLKLYPGSGRQADCLVPTRHFFDLQTREWGLTTNYRSNPSAAAGGSTFCLGPNVVFSATNTSGGAFRDTFDIFTPDGEGNGAWSTVTSGTEITLWVYSGGFTYHQASGLLLYFPPATSQDPADQTSTGADQHQVWAIDFAALLAGSEPSWVQLTLSNTGGTWPLKTPSGYSTCGSTGWTYCTANASCYAINGNHNSTGLWELEPPAGCDTPAEYQAGTWTITEQTLDSGIPAGSTGSATGGTNEPYNRLAWSATYQCLMWFDWWIGNKPVAITPPGL